MARLARETGINDASARQDTGGPSLIRSRGSDRYNRPRRADGSELERDIAGLVDQPTRDLRLAWRQLHRTDPPLGLSRDLLIRALAHQLQECTHDGASRALRRRLQKLTTGSQKADVSGDPGIVLKTGTRLVRHWRRRPHTVLVREDGFEYKGPALPVADGDRRADHWGALVGAAVLWPDQTSRCFGRRGDHPMSRSSGSCTRRHARARCAVYTRKSSAEGLDQEFNSLQAQREACEAFINNQRHESWVCLPAAFDDGGFSGATMDRPALQRLLAEITAGRVDTVVVYKIDRLTRSLADFAKIVEILDARGASFVSVTQQFNTTTSMGRLTLNVLLSFAQFEREVIGERIRDKIAASKKKGIWMGGVPPLGLGSTTTYYTE